MPLIIIAAFLVIMMAECTPPVHDSRLIAAHELIATLPKEALDSLNKINRSALSESDSHYLDFLTIKATDKAYLPHTSDSTILEVIAYAESHRREGYYPEALYYGGRVYSDLGDYPTALDYFHQALDLLPPDTKDQELRSRIVSQTGGILNKLKLYDEASPYIEESLDYGRQVNDTLGEIYDLQLLGNTYLRANKLYKADSCLRLALIKCQNLNPVYRAKSKMYLAAVKRKLGETDSALFYIRNILDSVKPIVRNNVLAHGAQIYQQAGIWDTAYLYADQLIHSPMILNKQIGYEVIFSDSIIKMVPADSLVRYVVDYHHSIENSFNEHGAQLAISQQSNYNYKIHRRERLKAEERNRILKNWVIGISFVLLVLSVIILWLKNRNKQTIIELRVALNNIERLEQSLKDQSHSSENSLSELAPVDVNLSTPELRDRLKNKLLDLYHSGESKEIPQEILQSGPYSRLQQFIKKGEELKEEDPLWKDLEDVVTLCSPNFKEHLELLVGGTLSSFDLHTALLIKCGVAPTQMAILFMRTKGTIVSRRESICMRIFGEKLGTKATDTIIRLL